MEDRGPGGSWRRERDQWLVPTPLHCLSNELLSGHARPTWVLPLLTPPSWRCQEKKTKQASSWGTTGPPRYLTHFLEVLGNPSVSWLVGRAASRSHLQHRVYLGLPVDESQPLELREPGPTAEAELQAVSLRPFCQRSPRPSPWCWDAEGAWGFHTTQK